MMIFQHIAGRSQYTDNCI